MNPLFQPGSRLTAEAGDTAICNNKAKSPNKGNPMLFSIQTAKIMPVLIAGLAINKETIAGGRSNSADSLILEAHNGERRIHRPFGTGTGTAPFILRVDPKNSGSKHLILFTEDLPPGSAIPRHNRGLSQGELDSIRAQHPHAASY